MNRDDLLKKIDTIKVWTSGGRRAPHKPLLLLLALGRVLEGQERLASYRDEIADKLEQLLQHFGPPRTAQHPEAPFRRLCKDGLWEIPEGDSLTINSDGHFSVPELRGRNIKGGFPQEIHDTLSNAPELAWEAAQRLLQEYFPDSYHYEIREAVHIPHSWEMQYSPTQQIDPVFRRVRPRDPAFRREVLREYEDRCAVCEFKVSLGDNLIGVEAAHIKWHAEGGPDKVFNGLALCLLHHRAFDRGALGLADDSDGLKVLVSREVHDHSQPFNWFLEFHDKPLRPPLNRQLDPRKKFVEWHQKQVFRKPPLP